MGMSPAQRCPVILLLGGLFRPGRTIGQAESSDPERKLAFFRGEFFVQPQLG
jgi:hypothetical protein